MTGWTATADSGLVPDDEHPHDPGDEATYNESMYVNTFDAALGAGVWCRIGNRPNEGHAEVSVCAYLPDGRVGFVFGRPPIQRNGPLEAAGLRIEVVEPFQRLRVSYDGPLLLLDEPAELLDPRAAFASNPVVDGALELDVVGASPVHGAVGDGSGPLAGFAAAHYEQHVTGTGRLVVGDVELLLDGQGLRDKSWGPRTWQAVRWYRWLPMSFAPGFQAVAVELGLEGDRREVAGVVLRDGRHEPLVDLELTTAYDDRLFPTAVHALLRTEDGEYEVTGEVLAVAPLRNRRTGTDGVERRTRITEAMTRWSCRGETGLGIAEHLDQLVDGHPVGVPRP